MAHLAEQTAYRGSVIVDIALIVVAEERALVVVVVICGVDYFRWFGNISGNRHDIAI